MLRTISASAAVVLLSLALVAGSALTIDSESETAVMATAPPPAHLSELVESIRYPAGQRRDP